MSRTSAIALTIALMAGTAHAQTAPKYGPYPEQTYRTFVMPTGPALKKTTACFIMHGGYDLGGNDAPGNENVDSLGAYLAFRGCPTFAPDYRLARTSGQEYPAQAQDEQLFVRFLKAQGYSRIIAIGLSAGAYNVLTAATKPGTIASGTTDPLFEAALYPDVSSRAAKVVAVSPFTDLNDPNLSQMAVNHLTRIPGAPEIPADIVRSSMSPVDNIPISWRMPCVLLIHGRNDPMVPFRESQIFATMMQRAGQPFVFYPTNGGHVFGKYTIAERNYVFKLIGDIAMHDQDAACQS